MNKYITEFIGTFFLVLAAGMASGDLAVLIIGATLMVMIFAGGHISGGHYNPAVTLAVMIRGKCSLNDAIAYWIAQFVAAAAAAFVVIYFKGESTPMMLENSTKALIAELIATFALAYVVLNVATAKGTSGNSFYGLAIGFTVFALGSQVGGISGGALNPAVALGLSIMKVFEWGNIWIYLVGCLAGGALAAMIFKMNNPGDN